MAAIGCIAAGCAAGSLERGAPGAAARGAALAAQSCASCHGMGLGSPSRFPGAPTFRDMNLDYNAVSYERRMAQMHAGRVSMPPSEITLAEVADIAAYIRSLKAAQPR